MADVFNTFEFVFSAKDLASGTVTKAQEVVAKGVGGITDTLTSMTTTLDKTTVGVTGLTDELKETVKDLEPTKFAFMEVQKALSAAMLGIDESMSKADEIVTKAVAPLQKKMVTLGSIVSHIFSEATVGPIRMFGDRVFMPMALQVAKGAEKIQEAIASIPKKWTAMKKTLNTFTFEEAYDGVVKLAGKGFGMLKQGALTAGVQVNKVFQTALGLTKLTAGKAGGLIGGLLGPLGPVLKLLSPIIDILTKAMEPALDAISAAVDQAFGPFQMVIEVIGQSLAPLIGKVIKPFADFMTIAAVQIGTLAVSLAEKLLPVFLKLMDDILPVILKLLPVLMDAFEKLAPPLIKLGVVLLEKVFAPLLIATLEKTVDIISNLADVAGPFIDDLAVKVDDFFTNFDKYMTQFQEAFAPEIETLKDFGKAAGSAFGAVVDAMKPVIDFVGGLIEKVGKLLGLLGKGEDTAGKGGNFDANFKQSDDSKALDAEIAAKMAKGEDISALQAKKRGGVPKMAAGGVVTKSTLLEAGEKGPEAILPLTPESVSSAFGPSIAEITLPGFDRVVAALGDVQKLLRGTLSVKVQGGGEGASSGAAPQAEAGRSREDADLDSMFEGVRSW